jgi:transcriptional regulator with XRE-family HTH domain
MADDEATGGIRPRSRAGIGLRIQQMRKELGLTQAELADAIARITRTRSNKNQVSQWETSRSPGPQDATIRAIASILGVSAKWLATGEGARLEAHADAAMERAVNIACWAVDAKRVGPPGLAAAIREVRHALAEDPSVSDRVLARVARLASRAEPPEA